MNRHTPFFGCHMQRTKGYINTFQRAVDIGANVIQVYSGNPRRLIRVQEELQKSDGRLNDLIAAREQYVAPPLTPSAQENNRSKTQPSPDHDGPRHKHGSPPHVRLFFHSPYLINLSNPDASKMDLNVEILRQELEVCELAGGEGVVVHTGKRKRDDGQTTEDAFKTFVQTIQRALQNFKGQSRVLIETSAGEGNSIGVSVDDFAWLYMHSGFTATERRERLGIVIDTCHVFGAGYDISQPDVVRRFVYTLHQKHKIPVSHIKLIHLNDSKGVLGSLTDFHQNLGMGELYANQNYEGLKELMRMYVPLRVPFVLETPAAGRKTTLFPTASPTCPRKADAESERPAMVPAPTTSNMHQHEIALCHQLWSEMEGVEQEAEEEGSRNNGTGSVAAPTPRVSDGMLRNTLSIPGGPLERVLTEKSRKRTQRLQSTGTTSSPSSSSSSSVVFSHSGVQTVVSKQKRASRKRTGV
jgi:deoxyribonuclease-4